MVVLNDSCIIPAVCVWCDIFQFSPLNLCSKQFFKSKVVFLFCFVFSYNAQLIYIR